MKIQRYLAKDMRTALTQVREALGPDAVILSSGKVGDEVEVVAAIDFESTRASVEPIAPRRVAPQPPAPANTVRSVDFAKLKRASSQLSPEAAQFGSHEDDVPPPRQAPVAEASLAEEVKGMRRMLEAQLATLTWNDMSRRSPLQAAMLKELARLGLSNELSQSLARKIPNDLNFTAARRFALATIARTVQVTGDRWLEEGGRVAFAGPAGAGKTTLIAKLAARWVLRHGPRLLGLTRAIRMQLRAQRRIVGSQHRHREQGRVRRAGLADGERRYRNALRHLHDRIERIDTAEMATGHRHPEHRHDGLGGQHPRQVRRPPGRRDDRPQTARLRCFRKPEQIVRHAMRGQHLAVVRNPEGVQDLAGDTQGVPIAGGAEGEGDLH